MFDIVFGFLLAVAMSIGAPDYFAAASKFLRDLPGKAYRKFLSLTESPGE